MYLLLAQRARWRVNMAFGQIVISNSIPGAMPQATVKKRPLANVNRSVGQCESICCILRLYSIVHWIGCFLAIRSRKPFRSPYASRVDCPFRLIQAAAIPAAVPVDHSIG